MADKISQAPQFVSHEGEEIPGATSYDNASKDKPSGSQISQTDPQGNVEVESKDQKAHEQHPSGEEGEPRGSTGSLTVIVDKFKPESNPLNEEGDVRRSTDSSSIHDAANLRTNSDLLVHHHGGSSAGGTPRKVARQSVGSDHSPKHGNSQAARAGGKGGSIISSPSWERKTTSEGPTPLTPGRSRLRSVTRGDDSPDRSPAVPKFGDWDDTDPATGEGYTQIFERVREEKHNETGKVPSMSTETSFSNGQKQFGNGNEKGCSCFPWSKR